MRLQPLTECSEINQTFLKYFCSLPLQRKRDLVRRNSPFA